MIVKLYNRLFVCPKRGHTVGSVKDEHYGGAPSDHCIRCGGYAYTWRP